MAFQPTACSKFVPHRTQTTVPRMPDGPQVVTDVSQLRYAVPDEVRQFPSAKGGAPQEVAAFDNRGALSKNAKLTGQSPAPLHRHAAGSPSLPHSFESRDWKSVSKAEFPGRLAEPVSAELQAERKKVMLSSSVPVGLCKAPFPKSTHSADFFPSFKPSDYSAANTTTNRIGGPNNKSHSDVCTAESSSPLPGQYTTMTHRQFQPLSHEKRDDSNAKYLKSSLNATHWSFGSDKTDYTTVAAQPLPSTAPLIKGRPPSAGVPREQNIFVAHSAAEARPRKLTPQEVAASKCESTVPLMGNQLRGSETASIIPRTLTASAQATPLYHAVRREPINATAPTRPASSSKRQGMPLSSEGLRLGVEPTDYTPMAKSQFPGVYFGAVPAARR